MSAINTAFKAAGLAAILALSACAGYDKPASYPVEQAFKTAFEGDPVEVAGRSDSLSKLQQSYGTFGALKEHSTKVTHASKNAAEVLLTSSWSEHVGALCQTFYIVKVNWQWRIERADASPAPCEGPPPPIALGAPTATPAAGVSHTKRRKSPAAKQIAAHPVAKDPQQQ